MIVKAEVLNSWKEVAVYLGRGVRTVQRWEAELGLPVRRPHGRSRSSVIALKPEIDRWLASAPDNVPGKDRNSIKQGKVFPHLHTNKPDNTNEGLGGKSQQFLQGPVDLNSTRSRLQQLVGKTQQLLERSVNVNTRSKLLCEELHRSLILTSRLSAKKIHPPPGEAMVLFLKRLS